MDDPGDAGNHRSRTQTSPPSDVPTGRTDTAQSDRLRSGTRLGRYIVGDVLGAGAMGVVYDAYDPDLDRPVAVKVIPSDASFGPRAHARLIREARALAQLSHPNVVQVHDVGVVGDQVFIAMERVAGTTLRHMFDGRALWRTVVHAYLDAARGLAAAHAAGLLHRDFKPDNVLYGDDGRVRVVDFGLAVAKPVEPAAPGRFETLKAGAPALETASSVVVGTPAFMAPEALRGHAIDERADQFSFCVALFHGLFGVLPFTGGPGGSLVERAERIAQGSVVQPAGSSVPAPVFQAIARGLAAHPEDRHPSMAAVVHALEHAIEIRPTGRPGAQPIDYNIERQRHAGFVGRAGVLARLDQLLVPEADKGGDHPDRWVVVTGGPGMGKSAILASWLARREAQGGIVPHHFIRRGEYDWDDPAKLVSSLIAQIEDRFPDQREPASDVQAHPAARLAAMLSRVSARELVPRRERLVLLIDGLDEYDPPPGASPRDPLAAFLPHALPRGVSFVCASRVRHPYVAMLEARDGEHVRIDLDDPDLADDNDATVRQIWQAVARQLALDARFVDEAVSRADGNPQHAVTLRKHVAGLPDGQRTVEAIPRGLAALLIKLWDRIATEPVAVHGLGLLCASREPLTLDELALAAGWTDDTHRQRFLRGARELLVETRRPDGRPEYRLHHDSIRAHVAAALGPAMLRAHHAALAHRLATWPAPPDAAIRGYSLRHALTHRTEAALWPETWQLAADMTFLEAKCGELGVRDAEVDLARAAERCRCSGNDGIASRLEQMARAVTRESHWLREAPEATAALLWNRLRRSGWAAGELDGQLRIAQDAAFFRVRHAATRESPELVRDFTGHVLCVNACAVTCDGRRVVSASDDRTVKIWDLETGYLLSTLDGHQGRVLCCAVTSDGRRVVSGSADHTLKIWDIEAGCVVATLHGHSDYVTACTITPDGSHVLSASEDRTLRLWKLDGGAWVRTFCGHSGWVNACAVSGDGRHAVSASCDQTLRLWELETGRLLATLEGHTGWVTACTITPDHKWVISASEDRTLKRWELDGGRLVSTFEGHGDWVTGCAVTPDGKRLVSASYDRTLRAWDMETGRVLMTLEGHAGWVTACAITSDGERVVSASEDEMLKLWELASGAGDVLEGHTGWVTGCSATPDGLRAVSASGDHTMKVWELETGHILATRTAHAGWVTHCKVTPDGKHVLSSSDDCTLKLWDLDDGRLLVTFAGHTGWIHSCAITADGRRVISASHDETLKVWDIASGDVLATCRGHTQTVCACAATPDGRWLVSGSVDRTLKRWDLQTGALLATFTGHDDLVFGCAITPDGRRLVSTSFDRSLKVWDLESGDLIATLRGHVAEVYGCSVTPDGRYVVSASYDRTLRVWDLENLTCCFVHRGDCPYVAVTTTADLIMAGDDHGTVWFLEWPKP